MDIRAYGSIDTPAVGHTTGTVFDSIFVRAGEIPDGLKNALGAIGVDVDHLQPRYPSATWLAALDLAASWLYPNAASAEEAEYEVGRRCVAGHLDSMTGRLLSVVLPLLNPRTFLSRLPTYNRMARDDLSVELIDLGSQRAVVRYSDPLEVRPHFLRGALGALVERTGVQVQTRATRLDAHTCDLECDWSAQA